MKDKVLIATVAAICASLAVSAQAFERKYGQAGCGLGSVVMGKEGNQILAATTNDSFGSQLFGITTGISNCVGPKSRAVAEAVDNYLHIHEGVAAVSLARGEGEHGDSLAQLFGCSDRAHFRGVMKSHFLEIYRPEATTPEVTDAMITVMQNDATLRASCSQLAHFG